MKKLFTLLTLALLSIGTAWAADFVDTYGALSTVTGDYIGNGISKIALGTNAKANGGIQANSKGTDLAFTVSVPTGFNIKSVVFTGDKNTSSVTCTDNPGTTLTGTITSTNTYTASANVTSVTFTVGSASNNATKLTNFVVTVSSSTTDDYELITPSSMAENVISYTSSLGDDKLVTAMAGVGGPTVGSSSIDFGNGKGFSITTSRAIKSVYCVWYQRAPIDNNGWTGYSEAECTNSIGTYTPTTNAWVAPNDNTQFVAFKSSEGSTHKICSIHIFYYNSTEPTVSASNVLITEDATDAGEISYTVDAKGTSGTVTASTVADWITLGAVDKVNNKVPFTATANSASVSRSATVTLTYTYNTSETVSKEVTVTQGANVKGQSLIKVTLGGNKTATVTGAIGGTADVNVQSDKKFGSGHYAGFTLAGGNTFHTGDIINVNIEAASSGGNTTITIYDTDKETILYDTGVAGVVGDNKFVLPAACNGKSSLYICRTSTNEWNAKVNFIEVSRPASLTSITPAYAKSTYVTTTALDFSVVEGLKAYVATAAAGGKVTLEEVGAVPAGTPLMLIGTAGIEYKVPVFDSASPIGTNMFVAGDGTTTFDGSTFDYILFSDGKFYQIGSGSVPVGKAYLHCTSDPTTAGAPALSIIIDGEDINGNTTGIDSVKASHKANGEYYNLAGQRVANPAKGLYIVNGKKYMVK